MITFLNIFCAVFFGAALLLLGYVLAKEISSKFNNDDDNLAL